METPSTSSTVILIRPSGLMLMHLRDDGNGKAIPFPDMWNFPGGGVEGDETHLCAAVREIREETEIEIAEGDLELIFIFDHEHARSDHIFVAEVPEDTAFVLHEGRAMQWMTLDEIKKLELAFDQEKIIPSLEKYLATRKNHLREMRGDGST